MIASIEYRGPDDAGEYLGDDVHLGVVRLSIIDIKGGRQPVGTPGARTVAVYNGEIYNYQELRRDLRDRGRVLPNECDSTVLPYLYEELGEGFLGSLRGMFAFALWDGRARRLLLARDRLGIKPLYWAQTPDYLVFASEIKAILASGLVDAEIDPHSLDDLFSLSYPCPPRTMFRGIYELRPAHFACIRAGTPGLDTQRYWRAPFAHRRQHRRGKRKDLEAEFQALLRQKIYDHLQSDVRVGTYLSGGLDSSSISALVKDVTGDPPATFSIGFSTAEHDERSFAATMVDHLGSENHTIVCDADVADLYPKTIWHTELPLQYPLALPLMQLSSLAKAQGCSVILTGEGADELMGGYDCFRAQRMRRAFDRPVLRTLRPFVYRQLYKWMGTPKGAVEHYLRCQERPIADVAREFSGVFPAWYDVWQALDVDRDQLLSPDGRLPRPAARAPSGFADLVRDDISELEPLDAELALEIETRLPAWILLIGDRAGMANGVEMRVPFLDHEVVEFLASLEPSLKMRGFEEKTLLRSAMTGLLPEKIRRRSKRPFYTPLKPWFFHPGASDYVEAELSEGALRDAGLFAPEVVKKYREDLEVVPDDHLMRFQLEWLLVQVLGTQLLHRLFVADFDPPRGPLPTWGGASKQGS